MAGEIRKSGSTAEFLCMDVTKETDWTAVVEFAKSHFGGIDILVNNAGWTYRRKDTVEVSEVEYDSS